MKKRLLITLVMLAIAVCLFAISVSAAKQSYTTFDVVLADGTQKTAYSPGVDQWEGRIYLTANLYAEAPLDSDLTYEAIDWLSVKELDFSNAMLYLYDKNKDMHIEKAYGSNQSNTALCVMRNGATSEDLASIEKITTGKLVTVRGSTFNNLANLKELVISKSLKEIQNNAFDACKLLASVQFAENGNFTTIGQQAFIRCSGLKSIELPNTITSMGGSVFQACTSLESFSWPTSYSKIPGNTFNGCTSLKDFAFPTHITEIGGGAFNGCTSLTSVHIPASITSIGSDCWRGASNVTSVTFDPNCTITKLYAHTFDGTAITEITIPNTVTSIGQNCFACSKLTTVNLGASFTDFNASNAGQPPLTGASIEYVYLSNTFTADNLRNGIFLWNDNHANDLTSSRVNLKIFYTGTKAQAEAIINKAKTGGDGGTQLNGMFASMTVLSYDEYVAQKANGTLVEGVKNAPARYFVYGYNKCDAFYNGEHKLSESYKLDFTDYVTSFNEVSVCTVCSKESNVNEKDFAPIFVFAGYSVKENDATALCAGYTVNHASIAVYKKYNASVNLSYGIVASTPNADGSALLKSENGNVLAIKSTTVVANVDASYAGFDFVLRGFNDNNKDTALVICSYVFDGTSITYMTDACTSTVPNTITYTEVLTKQGKEN